MPSAKKCCSELQISRAAADFMPYILSHRSIISVEGACKGNRCEAQRHIRNCWIARSLRVVQLVPCIAFARRKEARPKPTRELPNLITWVLELLLETRGPEATGVVWIVVVHTDTVVPVRAPSRSGGSLGEALQKYPDHQA